MWLRSLEETQYPPRLTGVGLLLLVTNPLVIMSLQFINPVVSRCYGILISSLFQASESCASAVLSKQTMHPKVNMPTGLMTHGRYIPVHGCTVQEHGDLEP